MRAGRVRKVTFDRLEVMQQCHSSTAARRSSRARQAEVIGIFHVYKFLRIGIDMRKFVSRKNKYAYGIISWLHDCIVCCNSCKPLQGHQWHFILTAQVWQPAAAGLSMHAWYTTPHNKLTNFECIRR